MKGEKIYMISSAEARLGKNMALLGAILIVVGMALGFLGGEGGSRDSNPQLALLADLIDFVNNLTLIVVIMYSLKLFNLDEAPFIKVIGNVAIIGVTIAMLTDLSPALSAAGFASESQGFTPAEVSEIGEAVQSGTWIVMPLFVLLVSAKFRGDPIPSWGAWGGILAGSLILLMHVIALSGLAPDLEVIWPIWLVAGLIGFPLFALGMSRAFASKI